MRLLLLLLFSSLLVPGFVWSQSNYSYKNYNTKDGLPSSTVYDLCQDKEGFLWFATESGVSRFDGTHFRNFTFEDGLPGNTVFKIFADSKGRVWMATHNKSLCYYYKGRIYNAKNDPLLSKIKVDNFIISIEEDIDGNILVLFGLKGLWFISAHASRPPVLIPPSPGTIDLAIGSAYPGKGFLLGTHDSIFRLTDTVMQFWRNNKTVEDSIFITSDLGQWKLGRPRSTINTDISRGRLRFVNTTNGTLEVDTITGQYAERYLPGKLVNRTMIDDENIYWFATTGEGVYQLVSKDYKTWSFNARPYVYSIIDWNGQIVCGSEFSRIYYVNENKVDSTVLYDHKSNVSPNSNDKYANKPGGNRVYVLKKLRNGNILAGCDWFLALLLNGRQVIKEFPYIKAICEVDEKSVMIGTSRHTVLINPATLDIIKTVRTGRSTAVYYANGYYYIGTPEGLYAGRNIDSLPFIGKNIIPASSPISAIVSGDDGTVWVSTHEYGILGFKGDRLVAHFTKQEGLSSNMCKTISFDNNKLWIGTDKGLNCIEPATNGKNITIYTMADGLPTDNIDAVHAGNNNVYIGSPWGLTLFRPEHARQSSKCALKVLDVFVNNTTMPVGQTYPMPYNKSGFKINYIGISYRSAGNIMYYYRLKGLHKPWDSTYQTTLEYPSLPPGDYELELIAKNRFGVQSEPVKISLIVKSSFWQSPWFIVGVLAVIIIVVYWVTMWRFRKMRQKEWEKIRVQKKISDLEQRVQRAQMNPHFIFNCLNSIQHFIIANNIEATNQYLSEFASLIRQTLDNSDKTSISVDNEIRYLNSYLEMEKMRFGERLDFSIQVDPAIRKDSTYIPAMFLQPYIENSIRHGLRHKKNGPGYILVKFEQTHSDLICTIEDNGVGRKKAMEYKPRIGQTHFSKATSLNEERMNNLNEYYSGKMAITIIDLYDKANEPTGTRVVISFPFSTLENLDHA